MRDLAILLIYMIPISILFAGAVYLMIHGIEGWGWLLLVGAIVFPAKFSMDDHKPNVQQEDQVK